MTDIFPVFDRSVPREAKEMKLGQKAKVLWFTGLSGSGKTTLAAALEKQLFDKGYLTQFLDGDNIRSGINSNLRFSPEDRMENIRRIAEVSKLFLDCGVITICAFISPAQSMRQVVKKIVGEDDFYEIYLNTPLDTCESRDVKGLYAKARAGLIKDFTGVNAPYDIPQHANLTIDTSAHTVEECIAVLMENILPVIAFVPVRDEEKK
ncbi:MAG: adenylyl-sulfate kinase [Prolixibacteraceae bacterium]